MNKIQSIMPPQKKLLPIENITIINSKSNQ